MVKVIGYDYRQDGNYVCPICNRIWQPTQRYNGSACFAHPICGNCENNDERELDES